MDTLTPKERSLRMSLVKSRDTRPELAVRRLVFALGYRYRLHVRGLPGCPDLVFGSRRKIILVHGCFWHQHKCPLGDRLPKSRQSFWGGKLRGNRCRDALSRRRLRRLGWQVLTVWECQVTPRRLAALQARTRAFLG